MPSLANSMADSKTQSYLVSMISSSPFFFSLIALSFLFIVYKNAAHIITKNHEAARASEKYVTVAYLVLLSSFAGYWANMFYSVWISMAVMVLVLAIIYTLIKTIGAKKS